MDKEDRLEISIKFNFFGIVGPTGEGIIKFCDPANLNLTEVAAVIAQHKKLILELFEVELRKRMMDEKMKIVDIVDKEEK